jgi:hypothetical protein
MTDNVLPVVIAGAAVFVLIVKIAKRANSAEHIANFY